jgi:23S rRNA pseudouridine2605 synthase
MIMLEHSVVRRPICNNTSGMMKKLLTPPIDKMKLSSLFSSHNRSTIVSQQHQHQQLAAQLSRTVVYKRWNCSNIYRGSFHCSNNNNKSKYLRSGITSNIIRYISDASFPKKSRKNESNTASSSTMTNNNNNINHTNTSNNSNSTIRISKLIATCMCISRKEVERSIHDGEVTLYGTIIKSPATLISLQEIYKPNNIAALTIHGKTVPLIHNKHHFMNEDTSLNHSIDTNNDSVQQQPKKVRVWLVHKMAGELVTDIDPYNRPTVMQRIVKLGTRISKIKKHEHIKIIGRLDMNTEGLLIVTNCGIYARQLELAKNRIHRTYRVRVHGRQLVPYQLNAIQNGTVVIDNIKYPSMKIKYDTTRKKSTSTNQWMTITCTQGKNRQIRNVLKHFHCTVTRLIRISYGDYKLQDIPKGMVREVTTIIPYDQHIHRGTLMTQKRNTSSSTSTGNKQRHGQKSKVTSSSPSSTTTTPLPVQWLRM